MSQQSEEVLDGDVVLPEEEFNEADAFGEEQTDKVPFWKREILFGYSLPWILGGVLLLAAGGWFIFGTSHGDGTNKPSDAEFSEVENTLGQSTGDVPHRESPVMTSSSTVPTLSPASDPADNLEMMKDIRDELNAREERINASIQVLQKSINQLSDAIKRDEAYAVETRNQVVAITEKMAGLETRHESTPVRNAKAAITKRKPSSPVAGMTVVSLENGMAWIKWQGSTWAVREGDQLGKVTINRIDPATRSISTTGGVLH